MAFNAGLRDHLATGLTTVSRAWQITRKDGQRLGFTDHDQDLTWDGLVFRADAGLSAMALQQSTGLSVDNSEALGAISSESVSEKDISLGLYDGAEVLSWLVNWQDVAARQIVFRGSIGEITRAGGAFRAELRGLTEKLNVPIGRVYQTPCSAVLGDASCRVDVASEGNSFTGPITAVKDNRILQFDETGAYASGWFERGLLTVMSGEASGVSIAIKHDSLFSAEQREIGLWEAPSVSLAAGDVVRVVAGCDKRFETCRLKFSNVLNFRGFPDIPQEDWVYISPEKTSQRDGGSRR